jgi:hypothetical protein
MTQLEAAPTFATISLDLSLKNLLNKFFAPKSQNPSDRITPQAI